MLKRRRMRMRRNDGKGLHWPATVSMSARWGGRYLGGEWSKVVTKSS